MTKNDDRRQRQILLEMWGILRARMELLPLLRNISLSGMVRTRRNNRVYTTSIRRVCDTMSFKNIKIAMLNTSTITHIVESIRRIEQEMDILMHANKTLDNQKRMCLLINEREILFRSLDRWMIYDRGL